MLKQEGVHFVFCPKQGNKMDRVQCGGETGVLLNRVPYFLE